MKKVIVIFTMLLILASPSYASFIYGTDTYNTVGSQLIVGSLGDTSTVSTFGSLGTNDWIPENAVKNYLSMEGYTTAVDYNPSVTNPQFSSAYNQSVPAGYTKITFAGLLGNPRATQDVYVPTIEYNRLNSEMQAERIDQNATDISDTSDRLGIDINNANDAREEGDELLQNNIDTETTNRINGDIREVEDRVSADNNLQNNINNTNNRIDDTNSRVRDLEKTQAIVGAEVRVYDSKKWTVTTFADYATNRNTLDRAGVRFTYKLGSSYEERRQNELEARLNKLEGQQDVKERQANSTMYTTSNGIGIKSNF